jgi:hypothetical protein
VRRFRIIALATFFLAGCSATAPTPTSSSTPVPPQTQQTPGANASPATTKSGYPAPQTQSGYPAPQSGYPAPKSAYPGQQLNYQTPETFKQGPKFTITEPVKATDTQISGTGPTGIPIKVQNITENGATIGQGIIGANNAFTLKLTAQLHSGDRIALALGETAGTGLNPNDFLSGPGYQDLPQVGILFTTAVVQ